jgi:exonuclease SbcD
MIRFLHAADLHLDSPFSGLSPERAAQRRKEQRAVPMQLAELANAYDCGLMLLPGDLFDSDNVYPETVEALARAFAACRAQIVIAPGNEFLGMGEVADGEIKVKRLLIK